MTVANKCELISTYGDIEKENKKKKGKEKEREKREQTKDLK